MAWHHLQYADGLMKLGHDVLFLEDSEDYPACYQPSRHVYDTDPSHGLKFASDAFERLGMSERWCYYDAHTSTWLGPAGGHGREFCASADIVINISGANPLRDWTAGTPVRIFVDTDPLFTQVRHRTNRDALQRAQQHNAFFTFGENVDRGTARMPDDGFAWRSTRQPIVVDRWSVTDSPPNAAYTTVMHWESYARVEHNGEFYGTKSASFEPYTDLPSYVPVRLEIALGGEGAPIDRLRENGWSVVDPMIVARGPWDYQHYIAGSRGEVSVAKQGYAASHSGWFSERSAAYLASGRPVVTQDTGFSEWLPVGTGVFGFRDRIEAIAALEAIEKEHDHHCRQARRLAEDYFRSEMVLSRLIEQATT
jgi:hypothetical protein